MLQELFEKQTINIFDVLCPAFPIFTNKTNPFLHFIIGLFYHIDHAITYVTGKLLLMDQVFTLFIHKIFIHIPIEYNLNYSCRVISTLRYSHVSGFPIAYCCKYSKELCHIFGGWFNKVQVLLPYTVSYVGKGICGFFCCLYFISPIYTIIPSVDWPCQYHSPSDPYGLYLKLNNDCFHMVRVS